MHSITPLLLSRLQFAWVIALHILLPALTVGLSCYIATLEIMAWLTKREVYRRLSAFWIKIFAVSFGMGVVSGIVMPFQFGSNWSRFSDMTANIIGPLMGYEILVAFFLESAFLGVLLFGRQRVPQWAYALSATLVAIGTLISSFWILAVNSWMHTPSGYVIENGRFYPSDMAAVLFNPSFPYRLSHTVCGFLVTTAFVVLGVGAYYLRRRRAIEESRVMVKMSLFILGGMVPLQILLGDLHGLNTYKYQPAKVAAIEGLWETQARAPGALFAIPDEKNEKNHFEIQVPNLASLMLTHHADGLVKGLKDWPREDRPPVAVVFFAFRLMVGLGLLMLSITMTGLALYRRGRLYEAPLYLRLCTWASPIGFIAVLAGWVVTEEGRQPWTVYGLLRTAHSVTPSLTTPDVALSLTLYIASYLLIFGAGVSLILRLVKLGPTVVKAIQPEESERAARPLSAVSGLPNTNSERKYES
jgi:cytochrome d ubiquinol oxidase subunit I